MATMFEPSLSTSMMRPPLSSADAPSMADSLPSINFGFDDLRERMARFTTRFDEFIEKGRKRVMEERNQFRSNVTELQEDQRMRKRDIEVYSLKTTSHEQAVAKESQETAEMHAAIKTLTTQRDERASARDAVKAQIAEVQKQIAARREAQHKHARYLDSQARHNIPELEFWQEYLGLRIEGAGQDDRLKFVYTNVDERDWEREAWFELDMRKREYEVLSYRPKVEREEVDRVLERLNESRDLSAFLKGMRELFVESLK
ncbi:kinetochore protein spc25 [Coniosporium apollinis CBS 100218]|uniref:Kinetochore protein SPC25 n=1 Tax=Coniosporium apollinis (strain CBS 100218) TaxID=1168221 RepID=R7YGY1_CONA1|nr:kinetochore protein spc25 [Coniosporium apollinis CBS 100218]EON61133.1 kinetochore protein spc25 [Coniosporium apollinis CBS 100218]